jgi:hypothetical protein
VGLSRLRTKDGLDLLGYKPGCIKTNPKVLEFFQVYLSHNASHNGGRKATGSCNTTISPNYRTFQAFNTTVGLDSIVNPRRISIPWAKSEAKAQLEMHQIPSTRHQGINMTRDQGINLASPQTSTISTIPHSIISGASTISMPKDPTPKDPTPRAPTQTIQAQTTLASNVPVEDNDEKQWMEYWTKQRKQGYAAAV